MGRRGESTASSPRHACVDATVSRTVLIMNILTHQLLLDFELISVISTIQYNSHMNMHAKEIYVLYNVLPMSSRVVQYWNLEELTIEMDCCLKVSILSCLIAIEIFENS